MKKTFPLLLLAALVVFISCNNNSKDEKVEDSGKKSILDSLEEVVMDGHDVGMAKYGKLKSLRAQAERVLDSIAKLPEKARMAAAPLKEKLDAIVKDLNDAKNNMDVWMREYSLDSAANDIEKRIEYLMSEKTRVGKVKEDILNSLQRADSILKSY
jgi:hypothetical protein